MCHTVIGEPFSSFVRERSEERNESLAERQDLNIAIDPEILQIIKSSTAISTQTGSAAHLLKIGSKRRRTKAEIDEYRQIQDERMTAMIEKDDKIQALEEELTSSKRKLEASAKKGIVVDQMMDAGFIALDADGTYVPKNP